MAWYSNNTGDYLLAVESIIFEIDDVAHTHIYINSNGSYRCHCYNN